MRNVLVGGRHLILLQVNPKLVDYLRYQFASERRCCFYSFIYPFIDNNYFSLESEKLANKIGIIQNMPTWFSARLHGQFPMFLAIEFPVAFLSGGSYFEGHAFAKSLLTASFPSSSSKKIEMVFLEEFILPSIISLYQLYSSKLFAIPLLQTMLEYFWYLPNRGNFISFSVFNKIGGCIWNNNFTKARLDQSIPFQKKSDAPPWISP